MRVKRWRRVAHPPMQIRAAWAAGHAAGNLSSGQIVPVLLKAARSGSTWVGSVLQEVSHRPFYLELRGAPSALQLEFVRAGVGFSTNPIGTNATRYDWAAFGRAIVDRAALVVLHRTNVVKHAISFLRVPQAHSECGGVKSAGCTALLAAQRCRRVAAARGTPVCLLARPCIGHAFRARDRRRSTRAGDLVRGAILTNI